MSTLTAPVADTNAAGWDFDNAYSRRPAIFFAAAKAPVPRAT